MCLPAQPSGVESEITLRQAKNGLDTTGPAPPQFLTAEKNHDCD